uniref:NADH dehydrogenase subunit 6 n=1 Tax=Mimachlamys senatoria TaxID=388643 RepID=T1SA59_9BIVA|nr:NADH dehydrogenase subunit 6 [Mimachlamys senatoria]
MLFVAASTLVGPQAVGICCLMLVLVGCLIFGYCGGVWLSHFVFLSFLGGLLVIFLYTVALAPSPLFKSVFSSMKRPLMFGFSVSLASCVFMGLTNRWSYLEKTCSNYLDVPYSSSPEFLSSAWVGGPSFLFLGILLAICMVGVTKLCGYNKKGALRGIRSTMKS